MTTLAANSGVGWQRRTILRIVLQFASKPHRLMAFELLTHVCGMIRGCSFHAVSAAGVAILVMGSFLASSSASAQEASAEIVVGRGQTMGSTYMVKIYDPPETLPNDWQLSVDRELRLITDQMSTYIESSEISRFNATTSLDWFPVSDQLAHVVARASEISVLSDGAFDITIMPLVKAWSFGPGKKRNVPPEEAEIASLKKLVNYKHVEARREPPALKKSVAEITIDLNAIAPGFGADRIVEIMHEFGAKNLFVEVGGEVRVTGDKDGEPWTVGIQQPDVQGDVVAIAYPLRDRSLATSGDYRSYFEFEGQRYSHTIDPRTGRPVTHKLASVTVLADDCMTADAMATTMSVLGEVEGLALAQRLGWDTLLMVRGHQGEFTRLATGAFESVVQQAREDSPESNSIAQPGENSSNMEATSFMPLVLITACVFGVVIAAMAIGVMFGRRAISGSCGGLANKRDPDGNISCALCSNPDNACKELRKRMASEKSTSP
jgi:FAD:protein FMN transferase